MSRVLEIVSRNGWTLVAVAASFLAGMAVMLPMGLTIDGAAAGLVGAIVGAVATIGGAVLLWQVQDRHRSMHLAKSIALQFGSIFPMCKDLIEAIPERDARKLDQEAGFLLREISECRQKSGRFDQSLHLLPSANVAALIDAETLVATMRTNAERVKNIAPMIDGHPTISTKVLEEARSSLRDNYNNLRAELEILAPGWAD